MFYIYLDRSMQKDIVYTSYIRIYVAHVCKGKRERRLSALSLVHVKLTPYRDSSSHWDTGNQTLDLSILRIKNSTII